MKIEDKFKILIVDDNINNLNLLASILVPKEYVVRRAINGTLALRAIQSSPPNLILLDISLPDISGYEICSKLKNDPKTHNIPIIFISASNEIFDKVKAFSVGGVDYISKPFDVAEVLVRVENQIALQAAKTEVQILNEVLEQRVIDRTEQLESVNHQLKITNQSLQQEIIERQQVQEKLRLFNSVVVNTNDAVAIILPKFIGLDFHEVEIIYVNQAFSQMTGYKAEEVLGKNESILKGPKTDPLSNFKIFEAISTKKSIQIEVIIYRKDGSDFWADLNIFPVADDNGDYTHWVSVQRDITHRKLQEQETFKALEQERELNELKSRFVATASHEFRTPLTTILSSVELLEYYGHRSTDSENREYFQQIRTAINRMTTLMGNILTLDKTEIGKMELNPAPLDLEKFCHSLIAEIQLGSQQQRDIEFVLHGQCLQATMDEQILRHIFSNLLSNAVKYSPVSGKISFEVDCTNQDLTFQIKDQGIGIPSEDQPRLFEPFFRAKNVGSVSGTGLGLSIVKRLVELHGGRVEVHSQVGLGTIFTVILLQKWNYCLKT